MESPKRFIGAINPLQPNPCFMVPIFQDEFGFYTQVLDDKDIIKSFKKVTFSDSEGIITPVDCDSLFSINDTSVKAFDTGKGDMLYGDKESLSLQLRFKIGCLVNKPFLLKEVADFLCDRALQEQANRSIDNLLNSEQTIVKKIENKKNIDKNLHLGPDISSHSFVCRVIFNQKDDVGKSTITCNLAAISAVEGKRTLVIDLDIQGNSTQYLLGHKVSESNKTIALFFKDCLSLSLFGSGSNSGLDAVIHETPFPNLFVIPSHPDLESLQGRLESRFKIFKLKEALEKLEGFDAIYIDTPPILNFYSQSALIAAEKCLIPFDCDTFARETLYTLMQAVAKVKAEHNQNLQIEGIIVNQFQKQANSRRQLIDELIGEGLPVLATMISPSIKVRESHTVSQPLVHFFVHNNKLSDEYRALYKEIQKK